MDRLSRAALVCLAIAVVLGAPAADAAQARKHVLILYDEDKDNFPGLANMDRSLRESLRVELGDDVHVHSESLALTRNQREDYESRAAAFYRGKYASARPELIVAVLEPALDFLLRHGEATFPGTPVIFSGVDATAIAQRTLPANVTGVLVKRTFSPTMDVVLRLQPNTRNVFVVGGAAPYDRFLQALVRRDLQPFESRMKIEYLFDSTMDQWLKRLSTLPKDSVILYVTVLADADGRPFVPHDALASITAAANAPVYVFLDQFVGLGAVGGNVYSTDALGVHVARLGRQILAGAAPASLPVQAPQAQVDIFDARQLKRWNLDAARLPPGSIVRHQEPSVWELYRWYIVTALAVLVTQGALIGGLLLARARRRRAEMEARRQRDDLAHVLRITTLGELTSELAHEISQPLSAILLNAQAALRFLGSPMGASSKDVQGALTDIVASADHASGVIGRLRTLFRKERVEHEAVDLKELIEDVVNLLRAAMVIERIDIRLVFEQDLPPVFGDSVQLEQVLLNVVRNACDAIGAARDGPRVITIQTRQSRPGRVIVVVADTGAGTQGLELERMFEHFVSTKPGGLGMGLAISRSIINAHGGLIWATRNPGRGLTVHIELVAWVSDARGGPRPPAPAAPPGDQRRVDAST